MQELESDCMKIKIPLLLAIVSIFVLSCKTQNNMEYLKNIEQVANQASIENVRTTIQPNDQLLIYVTAKDMSVAAPFNQSVSQDASESRVAYSQPSSNSVASGQASLSGVSYIVYPEGYIEFPIIGRVETNGKSTEELKEELVSKIKRYVISPTVSVRYGNYRVSVLGEVNRPGQYVLPNEGSNLLNVLALAGDLTVYGKRDNVLIVREENGVRTQAYVNLSDANFINSPYYHLKQNDVVYVTPNTTKKNSAFFGPQTGIYISVASIIVTILALVIRK